jgi:hypothetical protein
VVFGAFREAERSVFAQWTEIPQINVDVKIVERPLYEADSMNQTLETASNSGKCRIQMTAISGVFRLKQK